MNTLLNSLEKIAAATGELAILKESGIIAVVRLEKITIDPDGVTFALKPQRGPRIGLESLRSFSISANFEFLDFAEGRYRCSVVGWTLETDPVKVTYLKRMIARMAKIEDVLAAFRQRKAFYDKGTEQAIVSLMKIKQLARIPGFSIQQDPPFKGQSWGGAGLMVISNDSETVNQYAHFSGDIVITSHAALIGELFRKIRRAVSTSEKYNHLSKLEFWAKLGTLINAEKSEDFNPRIDQLCEKIIMQAIDFLAYDV